MKIEISLMEFRQNSSDKALADLVRDRIEAVIKLHKEMNDHVVAETAEWEKALPLRPGTPD